ncbi:hypothetical protein [Cellulomonas sp. NPDC058312]|uniref:hypothetical protein n=1 Tax=Cellulomonas sp. NPDC058312 TaxID=3346441 RepID=UPI0036F03CB5
MTSTAPPSEPTGLDDAAELRSAWATAADEVDALAVAERLLASVPADHEAARTAQRARLLLVLGRPADALALLPDADRAQLLVDKPRGWADVVALACWTAQGDAEARGALLRFGATLPPSHAPVHADLVAAAAEQAGDLTLADDAALGLPAHRTPFSVRRRAVAHLRQRGGEPGRVAATVLDVAQALLEVEPRADRDTVVVEGVVDDLARRQDGAAALLLLDTLADLRPGSTAIGALRRQIPLRVARLAAAMPFLVALVGSALLVAATALIHLPVAVVAAGVPTLWFGAFRTRPRTMPQLGEVDEQAARLIRRRTRATFGGRAARVAFAVLAGAVGVIAALFVTVLVSEAVAPGVELGESRVLDLSVLATVIVGAIGAPAAMGRLRRWNLVRQAARSEARAREQELVDLQRCACWQASHLRGEVAEGYAAQHLQGGDDGLLDGVDLGDASVVRTCPATGLRWLLVRHASEPGAVLLRGTAAGPKPFVADSGTGGYL